ncbi:dephospho-CoA kinase [Ferrimonas sediminum]|uniref:Dephospho-CoA kinase n=1 Tax=Ferrimonas sediminum TaxID=718193 RepID=A0A1G8KIE5_9GAMM|nr:dephospho-CoA kinase [Ferrimonas sediminum]SDI42650.1 dephospho-CoA kinase [Ferrimonas sediminum]
MSALLIGLTGGIGSGKTTVANLFADRGIELIDADLIAREVVAPGSDGLAAIVDHFGSGVLDEEGQLDRAALRQRVFHDDQELAWLNALIHPLVRTTMVERGRQARSAYALLVIPLLIENGLQSLVERVVVVDLPETEQIRRTMARDDNSRSLVENIMANQASRQQRLDGADDRIDNSGDLADLTQQVDTLHQQYLTLARNHDSDNGI